MGRRSKSVDPAGRLKPVVKLKARAVSKSQNARDFVTSQPYEVNDREFLGSCKDQYCCVRTAGLRDESLDVPGCPTPVELIDT